MTDTNPIDLTARVLVEAIAQLGNEFDTKTLVDRVRQLQRGLPAEDEFMLLLSWLGKCRLVHKLDQLQAPPSSRQEIRVPDLLAVFERDGKQIALLIEVKTTGDRALSWRPDYLKSLKAYAKLVNLPLLLAGNWTRFGFWTLADVSLFEKPHQNYRLSFEAALKNNLMGELATSITFFSLESDSTSSSRNWNALSGTVHWRRAGISRFQKPTSRMARGTICRSWVPDSRGCSSVVTGRKRPKIMKTTFVIVT